jgi:hypothetical protein
MCQLIAFMDRDGKNKRAREHCSQEMLNSCRKFVWMKICYWKFEGNLNTHVPLWAQQHMVDRHYFLNLKPWSARTLYMNLRTCRFSTKILRWSAGNVCLQVVLPGRKWFFHPFNFWPKYKSIHADLRSTQKSLIVQLMQLINIYLHDHGVFRFSAWPNIYPLRYFLF